MKRRANREGSLFQRQDGRWVGSLTLADGHRKSVYGKTREQAFRRLQAEQRLQTDGLPATNDRLTVGGFLSQWLEDVAKPSTRPSTFRTYKIIVEQHLVPSLGRTVLSRLQPAAITRYMNEKQQANLSARTVQYHHAVLRRALTIAERWGLVVRNAAKLVSPPRVEQRQIEPLSIAEAKRFLDVIRGDRLEALYVLSLALGLRQGEALGLGWDDLDGDARTITVRATLQRYGGSYHLDQPKTAKSRRTLVLPVQLVEMLKIHKTRQLEERLRAGEGWQGTGWNLIFCTEAGLPLYGGHITRTFQARLQQAGIRHQRYHDLRHMAATFMLTQGVALKTVQEVLGHSTIAVTAGTYAHVVHELREDAAERIGRALWS